MAQLTVIMPSYNKEKYIKEAINSIFNQKTSYEYQIIIADDCSSDKTLDIIKEYQIKYPDKITLLTSDKNQKLFKNILRAYEILKTDYFCVLDPDDYWISENKIQKALDFLEKNKEYTIYSTNTIIKKQNGNEEKYLNFDNVKDSTFSDFLNEKAVLGCTLGSFYRNVVFKNGVPEKIKNPEFKTQEQSFRGDFFRNIIHLHEGRAHFVPEFDAVYRITDDGMWQGNNKLNQNILHTNLYKDFWLYFNKKYPALLYRAYITFNLIKHNNIIQQLSEIKDSEKLSTTVLKLNELQTFFDNNQELIKQAEKDMKIPSKYLIERFFYNFLHGKLAKKGLIKY